MRRATGELRVEHRLILEVAAALERRLGAGTAGHADPAGDLAAIQSFLRLFVDACHHGKEESLLFPELERQTGAGGVLDLLLEEHRRGRALVRMMGQALEAMDLGEPAARPAFDAAAREYIDLIREHIAKEDGVFEMANEALAGPHCEQLCMAYEKADGCAFEALRKSDLEALAARILSEEG